MNRLLLWAPAKVFLSFVPRSGSVGLQPEVEGPEAPFLPTFSPVVKHSRRLAASCLKLNSESNKKMNVLLRRTTERKQ